MNRHRFRSDMEAAWELRPITDETPGSTAHHNRFSSLPQKPKKQSAAVKNEENKG